MAILKRIEVWILLLAVLGVLFWVLRPQGSASNRLASGANAQEKGDAGSSKLVVTGRQLKRDYGNAKLKINFRVHNISNKALELAPPAVRLTDGTGATLPPFFLPFQETTEIPAGKKGEGSQSYWLEEEHLQSELWLVIGEQKVLVKDSAAFALESVENQGEVKFKSEHWNL